MLSFLKKPILFQWLNLAMSAWPRRRGCDGPPQSGLAVMEAGVHSAQAAVVERNGVNHFLHKCDTVIFMEFLIPV